MSEAIRSIWDTSRSVSSTKTRGKFFELTPSITGYDRIKVSSIAHCNMIRNTIWLPVGRVGRWTICEMWMLQNYCTQLIMWTPHSQISNWMRTKIGRKNLCTWLQLLAIKQLRERTFITHKSRVSFKIIQKMKKNSFLFPTLVKYDAEQETCILLVQEIDFLSEIQFPPDDFSSKCEKNRQLVWNDCSQA